MRMSAKKGRVMLIFALALCILGTSVPMVFASSGLGDDPALTIVSPTKNSVMKTGNVLVSVKMTAPRSINMSLYKVYKNETRALVKSENYSSDKNLSYYTRQLTNLEDGVYSVKVSTMSGGKAIYCSELYISVEKKSADSVKVDVFNSRNTSTSFWSSLLKKLLG